MEEVVYAAAHYLMLALEAMALLMVAGLTFQLGADIAATTVAPDWEDLAWLVAVALLRTLLTYSLDRYLERARTGKTRPRGRGHARAFTD